jgi:hypothetical protein
MTANAELIARVAIPKIDNKFHRGNGEDGYHYWLTPWAVIVYPIDKWALKLLKVIIGDQGDVRNLGDVKWLAIEDSSEGKGTGRHIACFILRARASAPEAGGRG